MPVYYKRVGACALWGGRVTFRGQPFAHRGVVGAGNPMTAVLAPISTCTVAAGSSSRMVSVMARAQWPQLMAGMLSVSMESPVVRSSRTIACADDTLYNIGAKLAHKAKRRIPSARTAAFCG
jgi:hypothetical protein